mgnify:CR=1 FL=1
MIYTISIVPTPTPRPRIKSILKNNKKISIAYYPKNYTLYKNNLSSKISELKIIPKDYSELYVTFGVPYPKTVIGGKKNKIEGKPMRNKFDCDNVVKGLMDVLDNLNVLNDDRQIYILCISKLWTNTPGYIKFKLI